MQAHFRRAMALVGLHNYAAAAAAVTRGLTHNPVSSELLELQSALGELRQRPLKQRSNTAFPTPTVATSSSDVRQDGDISTLDTALAALEKAGADPGSHKNSPLSDYIASMC